MVLEPAELGLDELEALLTNDEVKELILATNATIEGEVTAHYIHNLAKKYQIKTTRIAHGIPLGGELEYTDINTIAHALSGRKDYN
jgi:recombination protein RecR